MKVNRTRFLLLTAALAGGASLAASGTGCTVNNTTTNGDGGTQDGSAGGDSSVGDSSTGDSSTGDSSTSDSAADVATCDDTTGAVPDCAAIADAGVSDGGSSCTQNAAFPAVCAAWKANLKNKVAANAINCAIALPSCESGTGLDTCLSTALNSSCADPSADAVCMSIASTCSDAGALDAGISAMQCDTYVSGLNGAGRTALQTCFTEGMCAMDFGACIAAKFIP